MPLFICHCPDYPNNLETRLANRPDHLAASVKDKEAGNSVFGRAFLSNEVSTHTAGSPHADQPKGMAGSVMIYRYPTLEDAWARIKADKYWTGGVWDKEKVTVEEIIGNPIDETIKVQ
ncbi:uncharacterized protein EHS24_003445 [Apiotrichum porosum]|uniref:YCII-related domain-containing protein n=1 Tax=Apiotrichum porosum TaxID=105984 RepID=A0A427XFE5_9TREE|nr:uncharacterized protein EHS24_003445 [Apiotrichum porosum]RSH77473.1 hypothetical protein EHS24_003445 [Apiotrichum porosum]